MLEKFRDDLTRLVAVRSVRGEPRDGAPYGDGPKKALETAAEIIREHGYEPHIVENAALWFDFCGEPTGLGVLAHLDVVDEGAGWDGDPYVLSERDGRYYGRGTSDDKGPALCVLYALDKLRDEGVILKKNVRVFFGSDEECGSDDLERLFSVMRPPELLFSPDAQYPVVNTEKGRIHAKITTDLKDTEINGGRAANIVPDEAYAVCRGVRYHDIKTAVADAQTVCGVKFDCSPTADGVKITCFGSTAHASEPENGINAITALLRLLSRLPIADRETFTRLGAFFPHGTADGGAQGVKCSDGVSGCLTLSPDVIETKDGRASVVCDIRTPVTAENVPRKLTEHAERHGLRAEITSVTEGHHVSPDLPFVRELNAAYESVSGRKGGCLATGGGTYVHDMEKYGSQGVAFGACLPETDTHMHGANEFAVISELEMSVDIFAEAIRRICG